MPLSDKETRELFEGIGELKEGVKNLKVGQEKLEKKIDQHAVFAGERKYIYGTIGILYVAILGSILF